MPTATNGRSGGRSRTTYRQDLRSAGQEIWQTRRPAGGPAGGRYGRDSSPGGRAGGRTRPQPRRSGTRTPRRTLRWRFTPHLRRLRPLCLRSSSPGREACWWGTYAIPGTSVASTLRPAEWASVGRLRSPGALPLALGNAAPHSRLHRPPRAPSRATSRTPSTGASYDSAGMTLSRRTALPEHRPSGARTSARNDRSGAHTLAGSPTGNLLDHPLAVPRVRPAATTRS